MIDKEQSALELLTNLFATVRIHEDQPVDLKAAIKQSKVIAVARKEHASQIADFQKREEEFERKINDPGFRISVVLTIVEEEGVSELVALNRTSTKAKLSQEALQYDMI